jgi:parallel beta-helix repeat protein
LGGRKLKETVSGIMFMLLFVGVLTLAFDVRPASAQAEAIFINADGSVSPSTAPIGTLDNVTYVLVDNVNGGITVQRSNIVIDGGGYMVTPTSSGNIGFNLTNVDNVTITNTVLVVEYTANAAYGYGFLLVNTNDSQILGNDIHASSISVTAFNLTSCFGDNVSNNLETGAFYGIALFGSCYNTLFNDSFVVGAVDGALLQSSDNNTVTGNYISRYASWGGFSPSGLELSSSGNNTLIGNDIRDNGQGVSLESSNNNILTANNITGSYGTFVDGEAYPIYPNDGIGLNIESSSHNEIYHNNIADNVFHDYFHDIYTARNVASDGSQNTWDDLYPSGGNYWSDYNGTDLKNGPYQNVTGSDGVGDTPYVIDANNTDNYPLMGQVSNFDFAGGVDVQAVSNSTVSDFQVNGTSLAFNVSAANGTATFCRLSVPTAVSNGTLAIFVNGTKVQYEQVTGLNSNVSYLYFTFGHSTASTASPEFPDPLILTVLILTVFIAAVLLTVAIHRKKNSNSIKRAMGDQPHPKKEARANEPNL